MVDEAAASELAAQLKTHGSATRVMAGPAALCEVAAHPDAHSVMAAIVGAAGLRPPWRRCVPASASCWPTRRPW